jgi:hypothetical protein
MRRLATVLIVLVLIGGCSKSNPSAKTTSSTSAGVTISSVGRGSIEPATTTTTAAKPSGVTRLSTPDQAAAHLFLAWQQGKRNEASQFASEAAVNTLFAHPYTGPEPTFQGCDQQVDHFNCAYRYEGGAILFRVEGGASAGYRVASVDFVAD